jgi:hypothetical protein
MAGIPIFAGFFAKLFYLIEMVQSGFNWLCGSNQLHHKCRVTILIDGSDV